MKSKTLIRELEKLGLTVTAYADDMTIDGDRVKVTWYKAKNKIRMCRWFEINDSGEARVPAILELQRYEDGSTEYTPCVFTKTVKETIKLIKE